MHYVVSSLVLTYSERHGHYLKLKYWLIMLLMWGEVSRVIVNKFKPRWKIEVSFM